MNCNFTDILVRICKKCKIAHTHRVYTYICKLKITFLFTTDEPPNVTDHPKSLKDAVPDKPATFTIQATGTEPLHYQWQWKLKMGDGNGGWQLCDVEIFPGANSSTLTIPSVQKSNKGSYRCTVSNYAGSETSESATLTVGELNTLAHARRKYS